MLSHIFSAFDELRFHPTAKRLRAFVDGTPVFDTTSALVVWEPRRVVPTYAIPRADLRADLTAAGESDAAANPVQLGDGPPVLDPSTGFGFHTTPGEAFDLVAGRPLPGAAFAPADADFKGYVIVDFDAFDEWREEDEILVGNARDPFTRIDARQSSRHVVVEIGGVTVADTKRPTILFETYLPTRLYLATSHRLLLLKWVRSSVRAGLMPELNQRVPVGPFRHIGTRWLRSDPPQRLPQHSPQEPCRRAVAQLEPVRRSFAGLGRRRRIAKHTFDDVGRQSVGDGHADP